MHKIILVTAFNDRNNHKIKCPGLYSLINHSRTNRVGKKRNRNWQSKSQRTKNRVVDGKDIHSRSCALRKCFDGLMCDLHIEIPHKILYLETNDSNFIIVLVIHRALMMGKKILKLVFNKVIIFIT